MGFLTRCKRLFSFAFLLQNRNTFFSFFLKSFLILSEKQHSPRGLHFAAQRCMALPPPAFSPGLFFYFFIFFDSLKSTGAGLYLPLCFSFLR